MYIRPEPRGGNTNLCICLWLDSRILPVSEDEESTLICILAKSRKLNNTELTHHLKGADLHCGV